MARINSFMLEVQSDELFQAEYAEWLLELDGQEEEQIAIIGTVSMNNWGGYEIGMDAMEDLFYRWNDGAHIGAWEPLEIAIDNRGIEWAYNPDQQAFLFAMEEVIAL